MLPAADLIAPRGKIAVISRSALRGKIAAINRSVPRKIAALSRPAPRGRSGGKRKGLLLLQWNLYPMMCG